MCVRQWVSSRHSTGPFNKTTVSPCFVCSTEPGSPNMQIGSDPCPHQADSLLGGPKSHSDNYSSSQTLMLAWGHRSAHLWLGGRFSRESDIRSGPGGARSLAGGEVHQSHSNQREEGEWKFLMSFWACTVSTEAGMSQELGPMGLEG